MIARRLLSEATWSINVPSYSYKEIERATNGFSTKKMLGTGACGTVYWRKLNLPSSGCLMSHTSRPHLKGHQAMLTNNNQNFHLSDKSDVYSFRVVLVEIITALKVVDLSRRNTEVNLAALAIDNIVKGRVDELIDPLLEPHRDAWTLTSVHNVAELAFRYLAFQGDMRPSMTEVSDELEQIRLSGWAPSSIECLVILRVRVLVAGFNFELSLYSCWLGGNSS
ncbi:Wall-associated receptor kinase-like 14 [Artemisia annua]|uniref:Wall-associated receptor kinase-like 14 n=1 Tax=Artemisia annua TaxID=35608 RepID=A0A2U1LG32_ARTAN|nr:Wall-associated receptor kinase-like 14 [Artemisia annua]